MSAESFHRIALITVAAHCAVCAVCAVLAILCGNSMLVIGIVITKAHLVIYGNGTFDLLGHCSWSPI